MVAISWIRSAWSTCTAKKNQDQKITLHLKFEGPTKATLPLCLFICVTTSSKVLCQKDGVSIIEIENQNIWLLTINGSKGVLSTLGTIIIGEYIVRLYKVMQIVTLFSNNIIQNTKFYETTIMYYNSSLDLYLLQ